MSTTPPAMTDYKLLAQELQALVDWLPYSPGVVNARLIRLHIERKFTQLDQALKQLELSRQPGDSTPDQPHPVVRPDGKGYYEINIWADFCRRCGALIEDLSNREFCPECFKFLAAGDQL
jgi:hypothetical protein